MKKINLLHSLLIIFFSLMTVVAVVGLTGETPTIVPPPSGTTPTTVRPPTARPQPPVKNPSEQTKTEQPEQPQPPQAPPVVSNKGKTPDIPKVWGNLISSQFLMDGAYLSLTFSDKDGNIRVASFKKDADKNEIVLYSLLIFNRTDNTDLKPVTESEQK
ncbi:MAG: hypothetical protein PHV06_02425 [bacterium]|nr:hypothetical protein [bacterium]